MNTLTKNSLRYYYYNDLFNSALLITACSNYLFNQFQNIFPQKKKKKCLTIYNGVGKSYQMQLLSTIKNDNIFTAARFVPKKGLDLLLDAFQNYNTMRLLIGGGDENQLNKLGMRLEGDIVILGELSSVDIANHLAISKLTVIPSKKEPYGIIVAEALSCGSPIVATNVGGIPEVLSIAKEKLTQTEIKVFNCWVKLVEPNAKSIEFGIDSILQNSGSIEDYLALVPKFRNQFIWEKRLQDYLKIFLPLELPGLMLRY